MSLNKSSKHSNKHHCSHEHIHEHNQNINSSNTKKPSVASEQGKSFLPPRPRYSTDKPSLAEHALEQELQYYKSKLARAEQKQKLLGIGVTEVNQGPIKAQLNNMTRAHNKVKKEYAALQKEHDNTIKKLNDLEFRVSKGDKQIQSLKTIRSSKGDLKKQTKKSPKKQPNPEAKGTIVNSHTLSVGNLQANSTFAMKQLQQENRTLKQRLRILEQAQIQNNSQFQPILEENTRQIRQLIAEKTRLMSENSEFKQRAEHLQSQATHYEKKYNTLSTNFQKVKNQYEKANMIHKKNTQELQMSKNMTERSDASNLIDQLKEAESKIGQLKSTIENQVNHIHHLQNTNRYLVSENKKLMHIRKQTVNQMSSNPRPASSKPTYN